MTRDVTPILKSAPPEKERKGLKQQSAKTAERDARWAVEKAEYLAAHPACEIQWDDRCTTQSIDVHHMGGRLPSVFFRRSWWKAACRHCHDLVGANPAEAITRGHSVRRHAKGEEG